MFGLPLLQHFVTLSDSGTAVSWLPVDNSVLLGFLAAAFCIIGFMAQARRRASRRSRRPKRRTRGQRASTTLRPAKPQRPTVLIDGSNVIYWQDNTPQLAPLVQVVQEMSRRGLQPGVVFDANIGYKLMGKFMGERDLSRILSLPRDQILVVPKGKQADSFLLETARELKARIVTNDRYRDWSHRYPDVARPETLIRGGMRDGQVWLTGLAAKEGAL